jgi:hypothetical protein
MLFWIVDLERGWDERIFPTSMKEGGVSMVVEGRIKIGDVSDQPRAEVWLVKTSILALRFSIAGNKGGEGTRYGTRRRTREKLY